GGIFRSTWTLLSNSYFFTPAAAIFQNSLALLVTNASLTTLGGGGSFAGVPGSLAGSSVLHASGSMARASNDSRRLILRSGVCIFDHLPGGRSPRRQEHC